MSAILAATLLGATTCSPTIPTGPVTTNGYVVLTHVNGFPSVDLAPTVPGQQVISDAASWSAFYAAAFGGRRPVSQVPDVDFTKNVVIVTTMGTEPSGGYGTLIESVTAADGGLTVYVLQQVPGAHFCFETFVSSPGDAVTIPRALASNVQFLVTTQPFNCG